MDFNDVIAYALRVGVIISAILITIGVVLLFVKGGSNGFTLEQIARPDSIVNSSLFQPSEVVVGVPSLRPLDFIYLGLMVLIATPVVRVILGIVQFAKERNRLYVIITAIVFFNLMFAIFILPLILGK